MRKPQSRTLERRPLAGSVWKLGLRWPRSFAGCVLLTIAAGLAAQPGESLLPGEAEPDAGKVSVVTGAAAVSAEELADYPAEPIDDGVPGGLIYADEVPDAMPPPDARPRVHLQGEYLQFQGDEQPFEAGEPYLKEPTDPPSAPRAAADTDLESSAPGDGKRQWTAIGNSGWFPPDTILAVGQTHVVEAVNSGFAIYSVPGNTVEGYKTFDSFMHKPTGWQGFMFDPRVIYDPTHNRFLMLILGKDDANKKSYVWIAVSRTSDPTDGWCRWRWDRTRGSGSNTQWLDYAGLGADKWGVYMTGNYFGFSSGFTTAQIHSVNPDIFKSDCTGATNGWVFTNLTWPSGGSAFSLQPALPHSINSDEQTFFVNTFSGSGDKALLWKLSGPRAAGPSLTRIEIPTARYDAIGNNVDQPGSTTDIDGGDARVMNAVYTQKRVFLTLTDDVQNDGSAAGWRTVRINASNNTREWQHLLWGGTGRYYFYPAVTICGSSPDASLSLYGSWTRTQGGNQYASALHKTYANQPSTTTGPFYSFFSGKEPYVRVFSGRNRWGDYSGAGYDWWRRWAWGAAEWADTGNRWSTVIRAVDCGGGAATSYGLDVGKAGIGNGVVTSDPSGISCGSSCSKTFLTGEIVELAASPDSNSLFGGWSGDCSGSSTNCALIMNGNRSATATFNRKIVLLRKLAVTKSGTGAGTVTSAPGGINCGTTCSATYPDGTTVKLTASPKSGSTFGGWGGACSGSSSTCTLTMNANRTADAKFVKSTGAGGETVSLYDPSAAGWFLRYSNSAGPADLVFAYGPKAKGWKPVAGDWNSSDVTTVGVFDPSKSAWFLRNSNSGGAADVSFAYGPPGKGWIPIVGDWDGNGTVTPGLYEPSNSAWFLRNSNSNGPADAMFGFGPKASGWAPVVGDWNGDGKDTIGLYDPSTSRWFLRNTNNAGPADVIFGYGPTKGWIPVTGDWDGDGSTTIGLYESSTGKWFLRNSNSGGGADIQFGYGPGGKGWMPLTGVWK